VTFLKRLGQDFQRVSESLIVQMNASDCQPIINAQMLKWPITEMIKYNNYIGSHNVTLWIIVDELASAQKEQPKHF
jgi:hypothetical protein